MALCTALACSLAWGAGTASAAAALHVIPFPGTPDASPLSQVIFSSLRPSDLKSVIVTGSSSGAHTGHLATLPDGAGTAFVPDQPFTAGETVNVTAALRSAAAGTASGDPGATQLSFSFGVEVPASSTAAAGARPATAHRLAARASSSGPPTLHFHSAPLLNPPVFTFTGEPDRRSGDIFLTPNHAPAQNGAMILNSRGQLVWFDPTYSHLAYNLEVQRYQGSPVLTWYRSVAGGQDLVMGRDYRTISVLGAAWGFYPDVHEFQITKQNTALRVDVVPIKADLSSVGGPTGGTLADCVIQELDVRTGQVLWEWHALGHVPVSASYESLPASSTVPYSFFHLNSIEELPNGNLLISAKDTWALYEIDKRTGRIIWTLGGKHSSFKMGPGTNFEWQHDAHLVGDRLTVFDDGALPQEESESSAKVLRLDTTGMTVTLRRRYTHSPPLLAGAAGSVQILPNGNAFIGWGTTSAISESTAAGKQIFSGSFPLGIYSYRAYRFAWSARPATQPALALAPTNDGTMRVYASWNGATDVAAWRVLGGRRPDALRALGGAPRSGFETAINLGSEPRYVSVQALNKRGKVLGTSSAKADPPHLAIFTPRAFVRASDGYGQLPVGCFTGRRCHVSVRISSGDRAVGGGAVQVVQSRTGALVHFTLSAAGQNGLLHAAHHRLQVIVTIHDTSTGRSTSRRLTLIPFATGGSTPARRASQSPTIALVSSTGFVSSTRAGELVIACYGPALCHPSGTVTSRGRVVATVRRQELGAEEVGDLNFRLTQAGETMLRQAPTNQLGARIKLVNGHDSASAQIALVGYS